MKAHWEVTSEAICHVTLSTSILSDMSLVLHARAAPQAGHGSSPHILTALEKVPQRPSAHLVHTLDLCPTGSYLSHWFPSHLYHHWPLLDFLPSVILSSENGTILHTNDQPRNLGVTWTMSFPLHSPPAPQKSHHLVILLQVCAP